MKKYIFLILHYCSIDDTKNCIDSIKKNCFNNDYEIVIVDNGSPNNTGKLLKKEFLRDKKIHIILLKNNLGFAKGNNAGFKYICDNFNADYIIMINNDIEIIEKNFLEKIDENYQQHSFSVLGPKIMLPNNQVCNYNKKLKNYWSQFFIIIYIFFRLIMNYLYLTPLIEYKRKKHKKTNEIDKVKDKVKENVILHGSCLIFSKDYISKFNGIDDRTFLYCEEELLYIRLLKNKMNSIYNPNIKVLHNEDGSTNYILKNKRKKNIFVDKNLLRSNIILLKEIKKM